MKKTLGFVLKLVMLELLRPKFPRLSLDVHSPSVPPKNRKPARIQVSRSRGVTYARDWPVPSRNMTNGAWE